MVDNADTEAPNNTYVVRVRQMHHAWFRVEALSPAEALKVVATTDDGPSLVEYIEDFPNDTWDVEDEAGMLLIEGRPVTFYASLNDGSVE